MTDKRYNTIKKLIESDQLGSFSEIFETIPPSVAATALHMNYNSLQTRLADHSKFTLDELRRLAKLINCDTRILVDLALIQIEKKKK